MDNNALEVNDNTVIPIPSPVTQTAIKHPSPLVYIFSTALITMALTLIATYYWYWTTGRPATSTPVVVTELFPTPAPPKENNNGFIDEDPFVGEIIPIKGTETNKYVNSFMGISFVYPQTWIVRVGEGGAIYVFPQSNGVPSEWKIRTAPLTHGLPGSLSIYSSTDVKVHKDILEQYKNNNVTQLSNKPDGIPYADLSLVKIDGFEALKETPLSQDNSEIGATDINLFVFYNQDTGYRISYPNVGSTYPEIANVFNQILQSIEITEE